MMWLDENVPLEYKDPADVHRAFQHLARTSTFLARVTRRQYFGFWSYANDHNVIGVCSAKSRPNRGWVQYRFPGYIMKMSRSKAFRSMRSGISSKISEHTHTSTRRSAQDVLPYLVQMFKADPEFRMTMINTLRLSTEEVAFLLDKKVDSAEVKKLMLNRRGSRPLGNSLPSRPPLKWRRRRRGQRGSPSRRGSRPPSSSTRWNMKNDLREILQKQQYRYAVSMPALNYATG